MATLKSKGMYCTLVRPLIGFLNFMRGRRAGQFGYHHWMWIGRCRKTLVKLMLRITIGHIGFE